MALAGNSSGICSSATGMVGGASSIELVMISVCGLLGGTTIGSGADSLIGTERGAGFSSTSSEISFNLFRRSEEAEEVEEPKFAGRCIIHKAIADSHSSDGVEKLKVVSLGKASRIDWN